MTPATRQRLATILERELDAAAVQIVSNDAEPGPDGDVRTLRWDLGRGRQLVVTFSTPIVDRAEKEARLATLIESFADLFGEVAAEVPRPRPEPAEALRIELSALAGRAGALGALVIDATSPVVWGASDAPTGTDDPEAEARVAETFARAHAAGISWAELVRRPGSVTIPPPGERKEPEEPSARRFRVVPPVDELAPLSAEDREAIGRRVQLARAAITRVRKNPTMAELHRGEHLHEAVLEEGLGYLARSFATIYVLLLVYPGPFDELGAERAVTRALPAIERLVVALPPDDAPTHGGKGAVVALRPRRRK
ncbi:hypothetical protein [Polyangium sp. y55x31]|uniref:hypothetical protein n=1 Tax=Polyangium sp. y55x31 TaxID=3042688 RepID=UPI0024827381|nr:hypothetical protein [Polyangium sp. y55x31]MDI1483328.1 hypothetical protein [Polyangium sp. y55x31]